VIVSYGPLYTTDDTQPDTDPHVEVAASGSCSHVTGMLDDNHASDTLAETTRCGRQLSRLKRVVVARRIVSGASTPSKQYYK